MNNFQTLHAYRRMADRGLVEPLACSVCNHNYIVRIDESDEPALECMFCDVTSSPGEAFYDRLRQRIQRSIS